MGSESLAQFLNGLHASRLLDPAQIEEVVRRPEAPQGDLDSLRAFLRERGWLTPYQIEEIEQGRGEALTFAGYRILDRLGEGPAGTVFMAFHPALQKPVVLKWVRADWLAPADSAADYLQRAQAASLVSHPHLANVLDAGQLEGTLFVVQEYFDGLDLGWLVNEMGAMPVGLACEYARQAASALAAAHAQNVCHGDLAPSALLVTPVVHDANRNGSAHLHPRPAPDACVKLLDLGQTPHRPPVGQLTLQQGPLLGHIEYMAPERLTRAGFDRAADLYGLGATLYYLLAARPPFTGPTTVEALLRLQQEEPKPIETLRSDVPPALAGLVRRLLSKQPEQRPSAAEAAEALRPFCTMAVARPEEAAAAPVLVASETATIPDAKPYDPAAHGVRAEDLPVAQTIPAAAAAEPPHAEAYSDAPSPFHDHHAGEGDSGYGYSFADHHDDDQPRPPRREASTNRARLRMWIAIGAVLNLIAIFGWLYLAFPHWFVSPRPEPTEPEKPTHKKKLPPPPRGRAALGADKETGRRGDKETSESPRAAARGLWGKDSSLPRELCSLPLPVSLSPCLPLPRG